MNDPYRDRKLDFEGMAKAFEDLAKASKNLENTSKAVMWSLIGIVVGSAAVIALNIYLTTP